MSERLVLLAVLLALTTSCDGIDRGDGAATALFGAAHLGELYAGQGGLAAGCRWDLDAGASIQRVGFVQVYRPISLPGMTCPL
jgi:hypothetical protein